MMKLPNKTQLYIILSILIILVGAVLALKTADIKDSGNTAVTPTNSQTEDIATKDSPKTETKKKVDNNSSTEEPSPTDTSSTGGSSSGGSNSDGSATPTYTVEAVGDIASCSSSHDETVAASIKKTSGRILLLGDIAYNEGTEQQFQDCFEPSWSSMYTRLYPAPGNHEYYTSGAGGYYAYFGSRANPSVGYYSFTYGDTLFLSLNSNCSDVDCTSSGDQVAWINSKLASTNSKCQVAYFHHPRFTSGAVHGSNTAVDDVWRALVDGGTDIVLAGHEHVYERFAKLNKDGNPSTPGTREFVVGTGGKSLYSFASALAGSKVRLNSYYGYLKLSFTGKNYSWSFVNASSGSTKDSGSDSCN